MPFHKAVLPLAFALFALAGPALAAKIDLGGQVTYRERIALPELAVLEIQLVDQTLPAAPPRLDVEAPIGPGQVPLSFTLSFEDSIIIPNHSYALIATISVEDGLLFRNFEPYVVNPLAPAEPVLIVTSFVGQQIDPTASSEEPVVPPPPAILGSTWMADEIGGVPVVTRSTTSLAIGDDMRAGGLGGCNSWFAQVRLDGDAIRFGAVTSTMKACGQSINLQEKAFYTALAAAVTWRVAGDELTLYGADGKPVMVLVR
jgi:putative lipoprotein